MLLERENELEVLDAAVRRVADGEAAVVVLEGPAGIGKTRLLGETRRRAAAAGLRPLGARGGVLERTFSFDVVRQLFEPVLADAGARSGHSPALRRRRARCSTSSSSRTPTGPGPRRSRPCTASTG